MTAYDRNEREISAFEAGDASVERELRRFVPVPIPPGLRARVLPRAAESKQNSLLTPAMRLAAAGCAVLVAALVLLDPVFARQETARLAALLDGRGVIVRTNGPAPELADVLSGQPAVAERLIRYRDLAATVGRRKVEGEYFEARERLKGRLENETFQNPD